MDQIHNCESICAKEHQWNSNATRLENALQALRNLVLFGSSSLLRLLSALRVNKHPATTEEEEEAA